MNSLPYGKFHNLDKARMKTIQIKLEDVSGDEIKVEDILEQLNSYLIDQFVSTDVNVCMQQIHPLITDILTKSIITSFKNKQLAIATIAQPDFRAAFIQQMLITFYFLKFIQKNKIKIISVEEDISKEEMDKILKQDNISSYIVTAQVSGLSLNQIIKNILDTGAMSVDELIESNIFTKEQIDKCQLE